MKAISCMIKPASGICNLNCTYCFYSDEMNKREQASRGMMAQETADILIEKVMNEADYCSFLFQGGEPTLAGLPFFRHFVQEVNRRKKKHQQVSFAIQTNGYLIDQEWCEFLFRNQFLIGLSLDGIKATHDCYRKTAQGKDTYFHTLDAAALLDKNHVDYNILTVVNGKTAPRIRKIYAQYEKLGFHFQQYIACLDPMGEKQGHKEYSLTPAQYGEFLTELFSLWYEDVKKGRQPYIRMFENYVGILLGNQPESCEQMGVCSPQYVIEADGSVYPCDFYMTDDYQIGNICSDSFAEIDKKRESIHFLEDSCELCEECRECRYHFICRGGCRRHRDQPGSRMGENYFCESYRIFFDKCLQDLQDIARKCR